MNASVAVIKRMHKYEPKRYCRSSDDRINFGRHHVFICIEHAIHELRNVFRFGCDKMNQLVTDRFVEKCILW